MAEISERTPRRATDEASPDHYLRCEPFILRITIIDRRRHGSFQKTQSGAEKAIIQTIAGICKGGQGKDDGVAKSPISFVAAGREMLDVLITPPLSRHQRALSIELLC